MVNCILISLLSSILYIPFSWRKHFAEKTFCNGEETFCNRRGDILWSRHFVIGEETFCGGDIL